MPNVKQKSIPTIPLPVWPDLAIYWTLVNFLKPLATINLPKSPTFLGNFCKGVKNLSFSSEVILGNFYRHFAIFSGHTDLYIYFALVVVSRIVEQFGSIARNMVSAMDFEDSA